MRWRWVFRAISRWMPFRRRRSRFAHVIVAQSGQDLSVRPGPHDVVLIRGGTGDKWLEFSCPNRCGTMIRLNLSATRTPYWTVDHHEDGTLSVHPSVIHDGCGAHFIVRRSQITWV